MGVIIKYQVAFPGAGLTVSNDLLSGEFTLDAEITVEMMRGPLGGGFDIKLFDLPEAKAKVLDGLVKTPAQASVMIKLGYFDDTFEAVMEGIYSKVRETVEGARLVTSISGSETGTHALRNTRISRSWPGTVPVSTIVNDALAEAAITEGKVEIKANIGADIGAANAIDKRFRDKTLMQILEDLAADQEAQLLVSDKQVHLDKWIKDDRGPELSLVEGTNLALFEPFKTQLPTKDTENRLVELLPAEVTGFAFTATGAPLLRPAHKITADIEGFKVPAGSQFRVHSVVHRFSPAEGYTCKGVALLQGSDNNGRKQDHSAAPPTAETIIQSLSTRFKSEIRRGGPVDVGAVKTYAPGSGSGPALHRATLYEGQRFASTETQPSIRVDVERKDDAVAPNKPIASPFAWHKCGLMVPVYEGMKALLSHNLALADDGIVSGFIWSEEPTITPPANNAGDWWLCLPIDLSGSGPPSDSTKAVNDLTSNTGKRVIEVKGLTIALGAQKLKTVGTRPTEGADDELFIDHSSGTTIKIDSSGNVTIHATKVKIEGDLTVEGNVEIK